MTPKEIADIRKAAETMTRDALVTAICTIIDDYKHQREILERLLNAASVVDKLGAQTGPQWVHLTTAIISARSALSEGSQG